MSTSVNEFTAQLEYLDALRNQFHYRIVSIGENDQCFPVGTVGMCKAVTVDDKGEYWAVVELPSELFYVLGESLDAQTRKQLELEKQFLINTAYYHIEDGQRLGKLSADDYKRFKQLKAWLDGTNVTVATVHASDISLASSKDVIKYYTLLIESCYEEYLQELEKENKKKKKSKERKVSVPREKAKIYYQHLKEYLAENNLSTDIPFSVAIADFLDDKSETHFEQERSNI